MTDTVTGTPDPDALGRLVELLDGLVGRMQDVAGGVGALAADVASDWPDGRGRGWSEEAELLRRDLHHHAEEGGALARTVERLAAELAATLTPDPAATPADGPRLGGTEAGRVTSDRGVRLATLPPG